MKRVIKFVKQNIVGFILGIMITGIGVVTAATLVPATGVTYSNSNSNVTNVSEALDELFTMTASSCSEPLNLVGESKYNFTITGTSNTVNQKVTVTNGYIRLFTGNLYHQAAGSITVYSEDYFDLSNRNYLLIKSSGGFRGPYLLDENGNQIALTGSAFYDISSYSGKYRIGFSVSTSVTGNYATVQVDLTQISLV